MSDIASKPRTKVRLKTERPRLHKVILVNDDYTPREFVFRVLKAEFRMSEDQAYRVMMTAHRRGVCVVAVYTQGHHWPAAPPSLRVTRLSANLLAGHSGLGPFRWSWSRGEQA